MSRLVAREVTHIAIWTSARPREEVACWQRSLTEEVLATQRGRSWDAWTPDISASLSFELRYLDDSTGIRLARSVG